jgi:hypothetical protein
MMTRHHCFGFASLSTHTYTVPVFINEVLGSESVGLVTWGHGQVGGVASLSMPLIPSPALSRRLTPRGWPQQLGDGVGRKGGSLWFSNLGLLMPHREASFTG